MNRETIERIDNQGIAAWDSHKTEAMTDLFAENFVWKDLSVPEPMTSKEQVREYMQGWYTAFPDMHIKQTKRVVGEDSVAAEIEFTGTNSGPLTMAGREIPPTGKNVVGHGAYFAKVKDGKIVEFSAHPDLAGMMMQLGLMPQG